MHDVEHNQLFVCAVLLLHDERLSVNADALVKETPGECFARENNSARIYICKAYGEEYDKKIRSLIHEHWHKTAPAKVEEVSGDLFEWSVLCFLA